ncbi:hypothetical protein [Cystobacter ferrugineus]|uniref:Uncharacterized protein n=1 Tax=Cystobacter ferrugineus TaxID=83449 RepID=A0A1L9AY43_9BACT|nr:hypothetical protein [Cystobacter ferrugineus]OJH34924.1 hypothetical protein BON30_40785 [Cystobacter ferrugineus]
MADVYEQGRGQRTPRLRIFAWAGAGALMLLPLVAMQFTDEVKWDGADFAFFGALLLGVGGTYELLARKTSSATYRAAVGVALAGAFLLVWMNAAVGIIGSEDNAANLMFGGVLAVGVIGAIIARFRPAGMARDLFATALAQVVVALIALLGGAGAGAPSWPIDLLLLTGFFATLWLASAMLFRRAAREQKPTNAAG